MRTKILTPLIALLLGGLTQAHSDDIIAQGNTLAEKFHWLAVFAQSDRSYVIEVSADESMDSHTLTFSGKRNVTVTLRGRGANRTLSPSSGGEMFTVGSGAILVLDNNITMRGGARVNLGGALVMNDGSAITEFFQGIYSFWGGVSVEGSFTMNGGTVSGNRDSGVNVKDFREGTFGGNFVMNGGTITQNYGGVNVESNGTFTMNGGTIHGNRDRGVSVEQGAFTISGGSISGNGGGGVFMERGTFTMSGGSIFGMSDESISTVGVSVRQGTFAMSGGSIGGGVSVRHGTFTMGGGSISGGGVYVSQGGTFAMSNGTISGNTAYENGGGVSVGESGNFAMSGGTISGNTAQRNGGGVYVGESGNFTMSGGTISGNTASENGGGVYVGESGNFTKTGGTITGYGNDQRNGNTVRDASNAIRNFRGHAVWAGSSETLLKIKEGTAGPEDNLSWFSSSYNYGIRNPPTADGAWDN